MSISPDQSKFTGCVLGEAPAHDQAAFDAALMQDASLREEALAISRSAHHLAAALKQEPVLTLTLPQRHAVLRQGAAPIAQRRSRPGGWLTPTLATAGLAAALAVGLFSLPEREGRAPSGPATGIPTVAIQPSPSAKSGNPPVLPPPALATGPRQAPAIPQAPATPPGPGHPAPSDAMAATPPVIQVPATSPEKDQKPAPDFAPPGKPLPRKNPPGGSLASPTPPKP